MAVAVPSVEQEAARDLVRAREDCRGDLMSARHRRVETASAPGDRLLRRQSLDGQHELWLRAQRFDTPGLRQAYDTAYDTMLATLDRRDRLDAAIRRWPPIRYHPGGDPAGLPARGLHADRVRAGGGDRRLARLTGRSIGAYLGLVPTEYSSGATRSQGSITKTGNGHARRLLIEAAWHHRAPVSARAGAAPPPGRGRPAARARGQHANRRLHARWVSFDPRKECPVVANTAIAR